MTYCPSRLESSTDRAFDTCLARLRDPDVQSLLDSLEADPPRVSVTSPCCPPLTPPLTPVATTPDMLQSAREMGFPLRRHSTLAESPVEERSVTQIYTIIVY